MFCGGKAALITKPCQVTDYEWDRARIHVRIRLWVCSKTRSDSTQSAGSTFNFGARNGGLVLPKSIHRKAQGTSLMVQWLR